MPSVAKLLLSGSTNGKGIKIAATATPGTTLHTAVAGTTNYDEIWLWLVNTSATGVKVTIEWGQVDAPDGNIEQTVPPESGLVLVIPGLVLQNGCVVSAFAETTNVVVAHGFVNRITS